MSSPYREISFNCIYVLESLAAGERTGLQLYEDVIKRKSYTNNKLSAQYYTLHSKEAVLTQLAVIADNIKSEGLIPYIHIEMHGNDYGLVTKSGELVTWLELATHLRGINTLIGNQLLISFATCYAANLYGSVRVTLPAPFVGFIAPEERVSRQEIEEGYTSFFESVLTDFRLLKALELLNGSMPEQFKYIDSQELFEYCWTEYYVSFDTPEKLEERIELVLITGTDDNRLPAGFTKDDMRKSIRKVLLAELEAKSLISREDALINFLMLKPKKQQ